MVITITQADVNRMWQCDDAGGAKPVVEVEDCEEEEKEE